MIDQQLAALAVERMSPEAKRVAKARAAQQGVSMADVLLDANVEAHAAEGRQMYAMRRGQPQMQVIQGGRA